MKMYIKKLPLFPNFSREDVVAIVELPTGSVIINIVDNHGKLTLHAMCDPDNEELVERMIRFERDDTDMASENPEYITSVIIDEKIWHIFEDLPLF